MSEVEDIRRKATKVSPTSTAVSQRPQGTTVPHRGEWFRWFRNASILAKFAYMTVPAIMYCSYRVLKAENDKYNFYVQKTQLFTQSLTLISKSSAVKDAFGNRIEIGDIQKYSMTSGLNPWLEKKHIWLKLKGPLRNGWVRIDLKLREGKSESKHPFRDIFKGSKIGSAWDWLTLPKLTPDNDETSIADIMKFKLTGVAPPHPAIQKSTAESTADSTADSTAESRAASVVIPAVDLKAVMDPNSPDFNPAVAFRDNLTNEQMRKMFPALPEDYNKFELNAAMSIAAKLHMAKSMDSKWRNVGVSVHPNNQDVIILYNSEGDLGTEYFSEALYENDWFKIKKPLWYKELQLKRSNEAKKLETSSE